MNTKNETIRNLEQQISREERYIKFCNENNFDSEMSALKERYRLLTKELESIKSEIRELRHFNSRKEEEYFKNNSIYVKCETCSNKIRKLPNSVRVVCERCIDDRYVF